MMIASSNSSHNNIKSAKMRQILHKTPHRQIVYNNNSNNNNRRNNHHNNGKNPMECSNNNVRPITNDSVSAVVVTTIICMSYSVTVAAIAAACPVTITIPTATTRPLGVIR